MFSFAFPTSGLPQHPDALYRAGLTLCCLPFVMADKISESPLPTYLLRGLPGRICRQASASFLLIVPWKQFLVSSTRFFISLDVYAECLKYLGMLWTLHWVVALATLVHLSGSARAKLVLLWMRPGIQAVFLFFFSPFSSSVNFCYFEVLNPRTDLFWELDMLT